MLIRKVLLNGDGGTTPDSFPGLIMWLDATDIDYLYQDAAKTTPVRAAEDPVGCWEDKSRNGNDVTQATADNRPLYKTGLQNGYAAVYGDGTNDSLSGAFTAITQPFDFVMVYRHLQSEGGWAYFFCERDQADADIAMLQTNIEKYRFLAPDAIDSDGVTDDNPHVLFCHWNGASSDFIQDGTSIVSGDVGDSGLDGITLYTDNVLGYYSALWIYEFMIYDPSLDTADRNALIASLGAKYNITIA